MGWRRLSVYEELAPGVAALRPEADGAPVLIVKPGSYWWPENATLSWRKAV
jgi:hypothetical protein